jgi:hypothetical protein
MPSIVSATDAYTSSNSLENVKRKVTKATAEVIAAKTHIERQS